MKIELLRNAFKPGEAGRARQFFRQGTIVEVDDATAKILIDKKLAAKFEGVEVKASKPKKAAKEAASAKE